MFDVEGFILVGGASSRMGSDKSRLIFDGQIGIERIADALRSQVAQVRLVGTNTRAGPSGLGVVPDLLDHWGALGGIHAALSACQSTWAIIVACDLPLVSEELFARLLVLATGPVDAIVPVQSDQRLQPLCAIYRRDACLAEAQRVINEGEHTPRALLARVRTQQVEFSELADLSGAEHFFLNVNTPADYELAKTILAARSNPLLQNRER